jgi:hypothetical protein
MRPAVSHSLFTSPGRANESNCYMRSRVVSFKGVFSGVRELVSPLATVQVQVQVCFTSVCGQVQPLDVALNNSV